MNADIYGLDFIFSVICLLILIIVIIIFSDLVELIS